MAFGLNRCYFTAGSAGTADFDDGTAITGFRNLANAGAVNGRKYSYVAENLTRTEVEFGEGTYNSSTSQLERADEDVEWSTNSDNRVDFTDPPRITISPRTTDLVHNPSGTNQITVIDEDDFSSDSATAVPTQQSVKAYVGTTPLRVAGEDQGPITGGASVTKKSLGSGTGTITVDVSDRPCQTIANDTGAFTLDVGTSHEGSTIVIITNGASAGAITTSGFDDVRGDAFTTTNGHIFRCTVEYWGSGMKWLTVERRV